MQRAISSSLPTAVAVFRISRRAFSGLPTGWTEYKDPSDGTPYYHHALTNTTQWEIPMKIETPPPPSKQKLPWETDIPKTDGKLPWETDIPKTGEKLLDATKKAEAPRETKLPWETDAPKKEGVKLPWETDAPKKEGAKLPWETDAPKKEGVKLPWETDAPKKEGAKLPWETDAPKKEGAKLPWETDAPKKTEGAKLPWETDAPRKEGVKLPWETDAPKATEGVKLPWETDAPKATEGVKLPWETSTTPSTDGHTGRMSNSRDSLDPHEFSLSEIDWSAEALESTNKTFYEANEGVSARSEETVREQLKRDDIVIRGSDPLPRPFNSFEEAWSSYPEILSIIAKKKYVSPTVIQKIGWSVALSGRDMIGVAMTGSGKTMAFSLPAVAHIRAQPPRKPKDGPLALVLVPTRELAQQIESDLLDFEDANIKTLAVFGGAAKRYQVSELRRGVDIVVATPGRLLDILQSNASNLKRVSYLALDEADRMLDMGFEPQIRKIVSQIRPDRQTMFWSATWPQEVESLARDMCTGNAPVHISVGTDELHANKDIVQQIEVVKHMDKEKIFFDWCDENAKEKKVLIFSATKRDCDNLARKVEQRIKQKVRSIHGGKEQPERDDVLHEFRSGKVNVIVATDVAQRGLDISNIDFVVNYDCPKTIEDYIHRIGRTARAGKTGTALTYFSDLRSVENRRMAKGISKVMRDAGQTPPADLLGIFE